MQNIEDNTSEYYNKNYIETLTRDAVGRYLADDYNETTGRACELSGVQFGALLSYVGRDVFGGGAMLAGRGLYDMRVMLCALSVYVDLCGRFDKIASVRGFSAFACVPLPTLKAWADDTRRETTAGRADIYETIYSIYYNSNVQDIGFDYMDFVKRGEVVTACRAFILQTLHYEHENALKNRLSDSKQAVGVLSVVNHVYGWNADNVAREERARALALSELPKLMLTDSKAQRATKNDETL